MCDIKSKPNTPPQSCSHVKAATADPTDEKFADDIRFLPYIVCLPTVNIKSIDHVDKYIVLASDGLYNFLSAKEIHSVLREADFKTAARRASIKDGETEDGEEDPDPADMLLQRCLELARHQCGQSKDEFQGLAPGSLRREVVDDITVLVLAIGAP